MVLRLLWSVIFKQVAKSHNSCKAIMARSVVVDLIKIFEASYNAVLPDKIIKKCVSYDVKEDTLSIIGNKFNLSNKNVYVVGAGKAVQFMAREIDDLLGSKIKGGIISIPVNSLMSHTKIVSPNLTYCEGAQDNLPDIAAVTTARKIKELASSLTKDDFLLVLISGGGSALLPLPKESITLEEKLSLIKKLANAGADIYELNIVRKKLSGIKGGQLAIASDPTQTVTIILSDVVNDPFDIIASGPTVEDNDDMEKAKNIIKKFNLFEGLPQSIKKVLETKIAKVCLGDRVRNYCLGSNKVSVSAAYEEAKLNDYISVILSRAVVGNVKDIAKEYVKLAKFSRDFLKGKIDAVQLKIQIKKLNIPDVNLNLNYIAGDTLKVGKLCFILGGETTVEVKGSGTGGRNQQLALEFSQCIHEVKNDFIGCNVHFLSAGTDGIDGPTNAAGAIGYLNLISDCEKENINVQEYLDNNDSYNFYRKFMSGEMHVITGHTNTNVMDTHLIIVETC